MSDETPTISFTLVGSGAVRVNAERGGPAFVVQAAGRTMLFDCGRGAVHGAEVFGFPPEAIDDIFVTHLHFDHVCDLPYLLLLGWNNGREAGPRIYGPRGLGDFLDHAVRQAYSDDIQSRLAYGRPPGGLEWKAVEIAEDGVCMTEGDCKVKAVASPHAGIPNWNFRVDCGERSVVITSDIEPDKVLNKLCRDADLLVCECSGTAEFLASVPWGKWHMTPAAVGKLARQSKVGMVILKHIVIENFDDDPEVADRMAEEAGAEFDGEVMVGMDGLRIDL